MKSEGNVLSIASFGRRFLVLFWRIFVVSWGVGAFGGVFVDLTI